jgi:hypothetical protein
MSISNADVMSNADQEDSPMQQPRTNSGKAHSGSRKRRKPVRSTEPLSPPSASPLDALVRGLASIGEKFMRGGKVQYRIP